MCFSLVFGHIQETKWCSIRSRATAKSETPWALLIRFGSLQPIKDAMSPTVPLLTTNWGCRISSAGSTTPGNAHLGIRYKELSWQAGDDLHMRRCFVSCSPWAFLLLPFVWRSSTSRGCTLMSFFKMSWNLYRWTQNLSYRAVSASSTTPEACLNLPKSIHSLTVCESRLWARSLETMRLKSVGTSRRQTSCTIKWKPG